MKTLMPSLIFISVAILAGCGQHLAFSGTTENSVKSVTQCVPGTTTQAIPTKFLFIVDMSGSNFDGPYEHPGVATDKDKSLRYGAINNFFQEHQSAANVSWGFETFNGAAAISLINSSVNQPAFANGSAMTSALQTFMKTADTGATPYKAALQMAHDMIQQDMLTAVAGTQYRIALLTDGYPTDYCVAGTVDTNTHTCTINDAALTGDVQNLINLAPSAIQMSTVYYGLPDAAAAARLQNMAYTGNGQFLQANNSNALNLDDIISVPVTCPAQ